MPQAELNWLGRLKAQWKEGAIILTLILVCTGFAFWAAFAKGPSHVAIIKHRSEVMHRIDLGKETEEREIIVRGDHDDVHVLVRKNEICVEQSNCPSQFCVHEGWQSGNKPIICAYNGISITFEEDSGGTARLGG